MLLLGFFSVYSSFFDGLLFVWVGLCLWVLVGDGKMIGVGNPLKEVFGLRIQLMELPNFLTGNSMLVGGFTGKFVCYKIP